MEREEAHHIALSLSLLSLCHRLSERLISSEQQDHQFSLLTRQRPKRSVDTFHQVSYQTAKILETWMNQGSSLQLSEMRCGVCRYPICHAFLTMTVVT
jgi:hypothetical protein